MLPSPAATQCCCFAHPRSAAFKHTTGRPRCFACPQIRRRRATNSFASQEPVDCTRCIKAVACHQGVCCSQILALHLQFRIAVQMCSWCASCSGSVPHDKDVADPRSNQTSTLPSSSSRITRGMLVFWGSSIGTL